MTDNAKKGIKIAGIIALCLGTIGIYFGGGSEGYTIEIVSAIIGGIGLIVVLIKGA